MFDFVRSLWKICCLFLLSLALVLLCGCVPQQQPQISSTSTSAVQQASPTSTSATQQASPTPTSAVQQAPPTSTSAAQTAFTSYVGKWQVHDSLLTISANSTGLEQWNAGPCSSTMCNGNAQIMFTENADGSIKGSIQSVSYTQWNGNPAPAGYQPDPSAPQTGDTFQLQHSGAHLLYTTWFGESSSLNQNNRYWCNSYASKAGWQQCGA